MTLVQALESVRANAGGSGSTLPLTEVGQRLRHFGWQKPQNVKLTDLLREMPKFCTIEGDYVRFLEGSPAPTDLPASEPFIAPPLFRAMVLLRPDAEWLFDLGTGEIIEVPTATEPHPAAEEPERYLRVPTIPPEEQAEAAATSATAAGWSGDVTGLSAAGAAWMRVARTTLPPMVFARVMSDRQSLIAKRARAFLRDHHIPEERYLRTQAAPPTALATPPARRPASASSELSLRQRMHEVVEQMTLQELLALSVPARFLLR